MIVVDSNILAYFYLPGDFTQAAERLFGEDPDWAAPLLWRSEFRNILTGYIRRDRLLVSHAAAVQVEAEALMAGKEYEVDSYSVFRLVEISNCSAYDCEFAALASNLGVKLVTMDKKLLAAFPEWSVPLVAT